jgi:hypothetical protein
MNGRSAIPQSESSWSSVEEVRIACRAERQVVSAKQKRDDSRRVWQEALHYAEIYNVYNDIY